jgi:site-specific recombinase XerD
MNPTVYKKFREGLKLRGYADKSQEAYIWQVKKLSDHYLRSPDNITDEELQQYLLYLLREKKYVRSSLVNVVNGLRHFYKIICNRSAESLRDALPVMRKPQPLPRLYSQEEITRLLCAEGIRMTPAS